MEVVPLRIPRPNSPTRAAGLPFSRRNVEEWSRIDKLTGITETAKIETDHWAARTNNAAHNYGKVIDSRERNNLDGSLQERQRKQMEVFQTKVPGGSMQVIRTQTITTSSKKWMTSNEKGFEGLELPVNSLDLSSQKTKGSVGRSGSIGGRRPPTRPRSLISQSSNTNIFGEESSVSRMCQHFQDQVKNEMFKELSDFSNHNNSFSSSNVSNNSSGVVITDVINPSQNEDVVKQCLSRQKSCSNENLTTETDNENILRRSSKIRRSLQCHKQNQDCDFEEFDWSTTKSLKERAAEIENLLRHGKSFSSSQTSLDKSSESCRNVKLLKTRDSFVSAETLKEVRDRLKKLNSSDSETKDDGIFTEKDGSSPVKCFEQDTEAIVNGTNKKFNLNGTGSLESRYSNKNSSTGSRSSEWYKRRKSYGFEQVDEYDKFDKFKNKKNQIDTSTDSGIWQSSETMGVSSWGRNIDSSWDKISSDYLSDSKKTFTPNTVTVRVQKDSSEPFKSSFSNQSTNLYEKAVNSVYLDNTSKMFPSSPKVEDKRKIFKHCYKDDSLPYESVWNRKSPIPVLKANGVRENLTSSLMSAKNPWITQLRGTKLVDRNWASDEQENLEINKRHSDGSDKQSPPPFGKENGFKSDVENNNQKKSKKVEFCKTEVHFAAESGKFNIVETDGKPPPNDIFRRRRRNIGPASPKNPNDLPEMKFGDSLFEKSLMSSAEKTESISEKIEAELKELSRIVIEALPQSEERENNAAQFKKPSSWLYDVAEEPTENDESINIKPKSILKNYRRSFLLGESEFDKLKTPNTPKETLKNQSQDSTPVWKSTVVLRNKRFDEIRKKNEDDKKLYASDGETELQIRIRNLRKTEPESRKLWEKPTYNSNCISDESKRRSLPDDILLKNSINLFSNNLNKSSISIEEMPSLSVAERVKQVEEMKSNNYSTKINFRSGEMTVVQNGNGRKFVEEPGKTMTSLDNQKKPICQDTSSLPKETNKAPTLSCDKLTTSNPSVMRFSTHDDKTDTQKYQTTRILINFETTDKREPSKTVTSTTEKINKNNNNKLSERSINTYGSWSSGMKKNLGRYLNDLKSASTVKENNQVPSHQSDFTQKEDIPKLSKPVHEIIDQFDSLSQKCSKEKIRKPIPTTYKPSKEYTHSDLEEELKNFTENLDKDFKDIYEEEIGILRKWKSMRETRSSASEKISKPEKVVHPIILNRATNYYHAKSSSDEGSKKSSLQTSSRDNYDTDDSDLLADEEVRSYMSTGHGGSESETECAYNSSTSRKSFQESILRFKKLQSEMKGEKEFKNDPKPIQPRTLCSNATTTKKILENSGEPTKVFSIALKYDDDSKLNKCTYQNVLQVPKPCQSSTSSNELNIESWNRTSKSSLLNNKPRERVSYLNGLSLSEKYSKLQRSSNSSLDAASETNAEKILSRKRISDEWNNKTQSYKIGSKSENELNYRKQKSYSQNISNVYRKTEQLLENKKGEKKITEEQKHSKYPYKNDYVESSRYRVKPASEKITTRNNQNEKFQKPSRSSGREKEKKQTDESMLEELKKAADQILMAVNGYTDDSSHMGSSEDDDRSRRIIRKDKMTTLGTISEGKRVAKTESRRAISSSTHRRVYGNQSSASSLESLTKEPTRNVSNVKSSTRHRHSDSSKTSSRTTRFLQRESSREALLPQPSSSEDIPSYLEQAKKRVLRRQRSGSSAKAETATDGKAVSSKSKSKSVGAESSSTSRTRERKSEKLKESLSASKSSRSNHAVEGEKTKSSSRKTLFDKSEVETSRRKRSQHTSSKGEHGSSHSSFRRKGNAIKKQDGYVALQPT